MSKCLSPLIVNNQQVPCGRCWFCLSERRSAWDFRLLIETLQCSSSYFITLTYSNEYLPLNDGFMSLFPSHVSKFFQDLRNHFKSQGFNRAPFKYYLIGEYGGKLGRPHYHLLLFLYNGYDWNDIPIFDLWPYGNIKTESVTAASIHYVTKYHLYPKFRKHGGIRPFVRMSKGIGKSYIENYLPAIDEVTGVIDYSSYDIPSTIHYNGHTFPFPRYYRKKITSMMFGYNPPPITSYIDILRNKFPDLSELELSQKLYHIRTFTDNKLNNYNNHSNLQL